MYACEIIPLIDVLLIGKETNDYNKEYLTRIAMNLKIST